MKKQRYKTLVLLATYNGSKYLIDQIESIYNQKDCQITLIVSDDCSSDDTLQVIQKMQKKFNNIYFLTNKSNLGFSKNFYNLIISDMCLMDNFDYVAFADQDDIYVNDKFVSQINYFNNDKKIVGQSSSVKCFGQSTSILHQSSNTTRYDFLFEGAGQGCTFLFTYEFFKEFRIFVKNNYTLVSKFIFHDWLSYLYARSNGYNWHFNKRPLVNYRIHGKNSYGNKYSVKGILERLNKINSGWYYDQVFLANKISRRINKKIPYLENVKLPRLLYILLFQGRRKLSDRLIAFLFLIPFLVKKRL